MGTIGPCGLEHLDGAPCASCGVPERDPLAAPTIEIAGESGALLDGRFRVGSLLARGGMGEVFEGYDTQLKRAVAIKFLAARFVSDLEVVARFRREAEAMASLEHPSIVTVYAVGTAGARPYFVMKRLFGKTLDALVRAGAPLPVAAVTHIGVQVCDGLDRIHRAGFVHRDVKPANIMVEADGHSTLLDFGILRTDESTLTSTGFVVGTPEFMSPEQGRDARCAGAASDIYSLGATLYAALTGTPPFQGTSSYEIVSKHHTERPAPPSARRRGVGRAVDAVIEKALAKDPARRFASARAMRDALSAAAEPRWDEVAIGCASTAPTVDTNVGGEVVRGAATTSVRRVLGRRVAMVAAAIVFTAVAVLVVVGPPEATLTVSSAAFAPPSLPDARVGATSPAPPPVAAPIQVQHPVPLLAPASAAESRDLVRRRRLASTARRGSPSPASRSLSRSAEPSVAPSARAPAAQVARGAAPVGGPTTLRVVVLDQGESTWSEVSIDGAPAGVSPIPTHAVSPGRHEIVASRKGFRTARAEVVVKPGETRKVTLTIDRIEP